MLQPAQVWSLQSGSLSQFGNGKPLSGSPLANFVALYIAEGCLNSTRTMAQFAFGKDEMHLARWIKEVAGRRFGLNTSIHEVPKKGFIAVHVYGKSLAQWLEGECGKYAANKRVPSWLMTSSQEVCLSTLLGLVEGDGTETLTRFAFGTMSLTLAYQVRDLAVRCGFAPLVKNYPSNRGLRIVAWSKDGKSNHSEFLDGCLCLRVLETGTQDFEGTVYNLEVDEDHSYQVYGLAVGNSDLSHSFMTFTWGGKTHTFIQLTKDCASVLASAKQFCRQRKIDMNELLIFGFKSAMGAEMDWPEARTEDLGIAE